MITTMISFCVNPPITSCAPWKPASGVRIRQLQTSSSSSINCSSSNNYGAKAFCLNPSDTRILKEALTEPVAFMGGMFAGLLRLDLNEDPLNEWVARTVEASGISKEEIDPDNIEAEEVPQQIEIE